MSILRLDQVELHFGTHIILDRVNLQLQRGDRLGLLGRNGAGKTTLFKVLAGDVIPDDGGSYLLQKPAIMGDEHQCTSVACQLFFQPLDGGYVEVVGGLVEQ